jgi:hypothetical protein
VERLAVALASSAATGTPPDEEDEPAGGGAEAAAAGAAAGGGKKKGKGKGGGFTHVPTHNPAARESGERRMQILRNLEVKRLESRVEKQKQAMRRYLTPEVVARKKQKVDPHYDLKGPARPARDFYLPPEEEVEPED